MKRREVKLLPRWFWLRVRWILLVFCCGRLRDLLEERVVLDDGAGSFRRLRCVAISDANLDFFCFVTLIGGFLVACRSRAFFSRRCNQPIARCRASRTTKGVALRRIR